MNSFKKAPSSKPSNFLREPLNLLIIVFSTASFNSYATSAAIECVRIANDKERLACYDSFFSRIISEAVTEEITAPSKKSNSVPVNTTKTVATTQVSKVNTQIKELTEEKTDEAMNRPKTDTASVVQETKKQPASQPLESIVNTAVKPTTSAQPEDKTSRLFGFEDQVASITPNDINSVAVGKFKEWKKKMKVTLENGQVWRITSLKKVYHKAENPNVVISKGALGSFYMKVGNLNSRIRVKRVK